VGAIPRTEKKGKTKKECIVTQVRFKLGHKEDNSFFGFGCVMESKRKGKERKKSQFE